MKMNEVRRLCLAEEGQQAVLQGNIAFAVGCVRSGIHSANGYPGTPSSEVIDRGLSQVQDLIKVGWSVNEAVATAVGFGHTIAGEDAVVTMKIPGLFQAGDVFTSAALIREKRGALVFFIGSDFTPSSTQHVIDPRYLFKSCMVPVFEPRTHQEMLEAAGIAADISRQFNTPVVVLASGSLCHSEGLVRMNAASMRPPVEGIRDLRNFNVLPSIARVNYDTVMRERMPALQRMVEESPLNNWLRGSGKTGVITYGATTLFVKEIRKLYGADFDVLSLAFTHPVPVDLLRRFREAIEGDVYVFEDGFQFIQAELERNRIAFIGKERFSPVTEWSPASIAEAMGFGVIQRRSELTPLPRPPVICAGCPYRLFTDVIAKLKKRGKIEAVFGDIGCNSLLYFMGAMDTGLAMGASDAKRQGYVLAKPEKAAKCLSIIGDSTECHSGMDATRNAAFRKIPGVKVVLDNFWTGMTGGQPSPASPVNLAGEPLNFDLVKELEANSPDVRLVNAYDRRALQQTMKDALKEASSGRFTVVVVRGSCIKKVPSTQKVNRVVVDRDICQRCFSCQICPGIEKGKDGYPQPTNLCCGCGGENQACVQMCPFKALVGAGQQHPSGSSSAAIRLPAPPPIGDVLVDGSRLPERLALAIRGVGGQGTLFFGSVMTQLAFLAGYNQKNVMKGETHGMAQMGGPVISTFACGDVHSPVLLPGSADCIIAMEASEILRTGFLDLLKPGGTVVMAKTRILPPGTDEATYPSPAALRKALDGVDLAEIDALHEAIRLGDPAGRAANVVLMGALSRLKPFNRFPENLWLKAIQKVSPRPEVWAMNFAAFNAGRGLVES